jgi:Zn-dependent protease
VHAAALEELAGEARACEARNDAAGALERWRSALALLPDGTRQREVVAATVARWAAAAPPAAEPARAMPGWARWLGPLAVVAVGLWKLVAVAKLAPFLALLASFGLYWHAWGWTFAAGFVASIYVHELGHVLALKRAGIPASAPMFIPGLGAFIRMHRAPPDARTDARIGLAGPSAGLAAALAAYGAFLVTGSPLARALAHAGAVVNLFNLVPLWQLDGARGFAPLARWQRFLLVFIAGAAAAFTREGTLWLVVIVGAFQAMSRAPREPDQDAFVRFAVLVAALSCLALLAR